MLILEILERDGIGSKVKYTYLFDEWIPETIKSREEFELWINSCDKLIFEKQANINKIAFALDYIFPNNYYRFNTKK